MSVVFLAAAFTALRIISLAPSLTEDLYAIGAGSHVVAVDHYSNRPAAAARLPRVGSMGEANGEAILALRPDLVVGIAYQARLLSDIGRAGVRVEVVQLDNLAEDLAGIERLGLLTGHAAAAHALHARIAATLAATARGAARRPVRSVFVAIGTSPIYTAGPGSYIDDLLRLANLRNIVAKSPTPWPLYSEESLVAAQPDIVVLPGPFQTLTGAPWDRLSAVRARRVVTIPEDDLLRPGPHVADVLRTLVTQVNAWR